MLNQKDWNGVGDWRCENEHAVKQMSLLSVDSAGRWCALQAAEASDRMRSRALSWRNSVLIHWTRVGQAEPALPLRAWSFDKYDRQYTTGHAGGYGNSGLVEDGWCALQSHPVKSVASGWLKHQAVDLVLFRME